MIRFILYIFLIYLGLVVASQVFFNRMAFLPPNPGYQQDDSIINLKTKDGNTVAATILTSPGAEYTILYSHGNATDLGHLKPFLKQFTEHGYNVMTYDYPGYGHSTGSPTEKNTYAALQAAYDYLTKPLNQPYHSIILWGQSIGAAVALDIATKEPCAGLVLESPFVSAFRTYTQIQLLPFDRYNNLKKAKDIKCPVLVLHGQRDRIIPAWQGVSVFSHAPEPKQFFFMPQAGHNNLIGVSGKRFWENFTHFIKVIRGEAKPENFPKKIDIPSPGNSK